MLIDGILSSQCILIFKYFCNCLPHSYILGIMFLSFPFICQDKWNGKDRLGSVSHLCFRERRMSWDSRSTVSLEISGSGLCFLSVVHVKSEDNWQSKAPSSVCFEMTFFSMPVDAKGVFILKQAGSFNEASRTFLWLNPYGFLLTQWVGMIDSTLHPNSQSLTHISSIAHYFSI